MRMLKTRSGTVTIVHLQGKFDGGKDCQEMNLEFQKMVDAGDIEYVFNFKKVRFVTSNGLGCLIKAQKALDLVKGKIVLCNLNDRNLSVIHTTHLEQIFDVVDSLPKALELFDPQAAKAAAVESADSPDAGLDQ